MSDQLNIDHLALLARLSLDDSARGAAREELGAIIAMIDQMQAINTDGVTPMAHPHDATQRLRADAVTEQVDRDTLQAGAPRARDGYYLVPRVVD